jgi:hypothetical protein
MRVLVIDPILFLAPVLVQRLVQDGHEVVYAPIWGPKSDSPFMDALCRGLGAKVDPEGWMNYLDWAEVATITGSEHRGHIPKFLRAAGVPVCGPGPWGTRLELDRSFGHQVFRDAGMNPSTQHVFADADEAAEFVRGTPQRYVVKLDQTARAIAETFVGADPDGRDVRAYLRDLAFKLRFTDGRVKVYLEEPLNGAEVGIGGWFNGETFLGDLMVTFETDGGYAYDLRLDASKLIDTKKLEAVLRKAKFRGSFDMNGFLDEDRSWRPVEWTPRWGAGTTEMMAHSVPDLGALLLAAATGKDAPVIRDELLDSVVALVNTRDEDSDMTSPSEIIVNGDKLPYRTKTGSFWARWPSKTDEGWLSLPVLGTSERRTGVYVGSGPTLDQALEMASELSSDVKVANSHIETGRAREDMAPMWSQVVRLLTGAAPETEWVTHMARSTAHMWKRSA